MVKHIVIFKFKPGVSWDDPRALEAEDAFINMGDKIPEIKGYFVGRNFSERPIAYDYALIADVEDREAIQNYLIHPEHQAAAKLWAEISTWNMADVEF
jgi:hypothetical protein